MEQNFQTSFIPKKSIVQERTSTPRPVGLLVIGAIFILVAVLVGTGVLYFYKGIMTKNIAQMQADLNLAKARFEPARIIELGELDRRLKAGSEILSKHIAVTPIFKELQLVTKKEVRFTKFSYILPMVAGDKILVKMNGSADGYRTVALQSDLFTVNRHFIDPVFSNLTLNDQGKVLFDLEFAVDPSFVDYRQSLLTEADNATEGLEEGINLPGAPTF